MEKPVLSCSFYGKKQSEVAKLVAGPNTYICNECVQICVEIIEDDKAVGQRLAAAVREELTRALELLEAARLVAVQGYDRVAVDLVRESVHRSLNAHELKRDGHVSHRDFERLTLGLLHDGALQDVMGVDVTPLLKEYPGGVRVAADDVRTALETARVLYEFVAATAQHN